MIKILFIPLIFLFGCKNYPTKIVWSNDIKISCEEIIERSDGLRFVVNLKIENNSSNDVVINVNNGKPEMSTFFIITKNGDSIPMEIYNRLNFATIKAKTNYIAQGSFNRALFWKSNKNRNSAEGIKGAKIIYLPDINAIKSFSIENKKQEIYAVKSTEILLKDKQILSKDEHKYIPEISLIKN